MAGLAKKRTLRFSGAASLRDRLVLSLLSGTPIRVSDIRVDSTQPGLSPAEISFIRLLDKVTSGSGIHINDTGTVLVFRPGHLSGPERATLTHVCHPSRGLSYYARPLLALAPFFKRPLRVVLRGATHAASDACADALAAVCAPLLRRLALGAALAPAASVSRRAFATPAGGDRPGAAPSGEVVVSCGLLTGKVPPVDLLAAGVVKRVRGIAFANRTSPAALSRMVDAARGVLNRFSPDVYIHTDHSNAPDAGVGYALHLVAETTEGCLLSADWCATQPDVTPERVAQTAVNLLLEEIADGGCVDSDSAGLAILYCALADSEVSRVRVGKLSESCVTLLRDLKQFLGVVFKVRVEDVPSESDSEESDDSDEEDDEEGEDGEGGNEGQAGEKKKKRGVKERGIVLSCVGIGHSNIARQRF